MLFGHFPPKKTCRDDQWTCWLLWLFLASHSSDKFEILKLPLISFVVIIIIHKDYWFKKLYKPKWRNQSQGFFISRLVALYWKVPPLQPFFQFLQGERDYVFSMFEITSSVDGIKISQKIYSSGKVPDVAIGVRVSKQIKSKVALSKTGGSGCE